MTTSWRLRTVVVICVISATTQRMCEAQLVAPLPKGVKAVWDVSKAHRVTTPTRERICINGLWRWQPAKTKTDRVPTGD